MPMEPNKKQLSKTQAAVGAVGAVLLAGAIALAANAGRVCATVQSPIGRAICETIVATAQDEREQLPEHESFDGGAGGEL